MPMPVSNIFEGVDFNTVLIIVSAVGYLIAKYRTGGREAKIEAVAAQEQTEDARSSYVDLLKGQLESQKQINEENKVKLGLLQEQINSLKQEIGKLQGVNETIDKILSRGAPELDRTLQSMNLFIAESQLFQTEMRKHFNLKNPDSVQEMHRRVNSRAKAA
jgi:hypothetical protein